MNKREMAIIASIAALSGCSKSNVEREQARAITRQMIGDPSKEIQNFRWGGTASDPWPSKPVLLDLPATIQKSRVPR